MTQIPLLIREKIEYYLNLIYLEKWKKKMWYVLHNYYKDLSCFYFYNDHCNISQAILTTMDKMNLKIKPNSYHSYHQEIFAHKTKFYERIRWSFGEFYI